MGKYFDTGYTEIKFHLFGTPHLLVLLSISILCFSVFYIKRTTPLTQRIFRYTIAFTMISNELLWHILEYYFGYWQLKYTLPLHLCSVASYISVYCLLTRRKIFYDFLFFLGFLGATQALLTPNIRDYAFPHYRFFSTFITHGGIAVTVFYITIIEGYRPRLQSLGKLFVVFNVYAIFVGLINYLVGGNYIFLCEKPNGSALNFLGPWPWYIVSMEIAAIIFCFFMYLPFAIRNLLTRRSLENNKI